MTSRVLVTARLPFRLIDFCCACWCVRRTIATSAVVTVRSSLGTAVPVQVFHKSVLVKDDEELLQVPLHRESNT